MEPIAALPILASVLNGRYDYEVIDCNGQDYSEEQYMETLKMSNPDGVLITALSVELHKHYSKVAELSKEALPESITIMGGVYSTTCYDHAMKDRSVDYIMLGHAEERLCEVLDAIFENRDLSDIAGVGFRKGGDSH
jgi:anaerobic magnesium-protoporphyrin IX monomethyl ester cyclase